MKTLLTTLALTAASLALTAAPSFAYTINMGGTYVEPLGGFEYIQYFIGAPLSLSLEDGQYKPRAAGAINFLESWSSLEAGLGNGFATSIVFPYDFVQAQGGGPVQSGLSGVTWTLSRQLWKDATTAGRLRFRADVPIGGESSPTYLGLLASASNQLTPSLRGVLNLNYYHGVPRTVQGLAGATDVSYAGSKAQFDAALDYTITPHVSVVLEGLAHWQLPSSTASAGTDPRSGAFTFQLAPGVTYMFSDSFALQASLAAPVVSTGNSSTASPWTAIVGSCWDF